MGESVEEEVKREMEGGCGERERALGRAEERAKVEGWRVAILDSQSPRGKSRLFRARIRFSKCSFHVLEISCYTHFRFRRRYSVVLNK